MFLQILLASTVLESLNVIIMDHEQVSLKSEIVDIIHKNDGTTLTIPSVSFAPGELDKVQFTDPQTITVGHVELAAGDENVGGDTATVGCVIAYPKNNPIKGLVFHIYGGGIDTGYSQLGQIKDDGFGHVFCRARDVRQVKENRHRELEHQRKYTPDFLEEVTSDILKLQRYVTEHASTFEGIQLVNQWSSVIDTASFGGKLVSHLIANNAQHNFDGFILQVPGIAQFQLDVPISDVVQNLNVPISMNIGLLDDRIYKGLVLEWYDAMKAAGKLHLLTLRTFTNRGHFDTQAVSDSKPFLDYIDDLKHNPAQAKIKTEWNEAVTTYIYERLKEGLPFPIGVINVLNDPYQISRNKFWAWEEPHHDQQSGLKKSPYASVLPYINVEFLEKNRAIIGAIEQILYPKMSDQEITESCTMWSWHKSFMEQVPSNPKLAKPLLTAYFIAHLQDLVRDDIQERVKDLDKIIKKFQDDPTLAPRTKVLARYFFPDFVPNDVENFTMQHDLGIFSDSLVNVGLKLIFAFVADLLTQNFSGQAEYLIKNDPSKLLSLIQHTSSEEIEEFIHYVPILFPKLQNDPSLKDQFITWHQTIKRMKSEWELLYFVEAMAKTATPENQHALEAFVVTIVTLKQFNKEIPLAFIKGLASFAQESEKIESLVKFACILSPTLQEEKARETLNNFLKVSVSLTTDPFALQDIQVQDASEFETAIFPCIIAIATLCGEFTLKSVLEKDFDDYEAEIAAVKKSIAEKPELKEQRRKMWSSLAKGLSK